MNRRPAAFTMISILLTTILCSSVAYVMTNEFDFSDPQDLNLLLLLVCAASLLGIAALGTWRPRPWGYLALVSAIALIAGLDLIAFLSTRTFSIYFLPDLVLVGSGILMLWDHNARDLFFDQSKRWWETARRVALGLSSQERDDSGIEIVNISTTGCLIKCTKERKLGESVELKIAPDFWLKAVLVRQTSPEANVYGARFEFRSWSQRRQLRKFVEMADTIVTKLAEDHEDTERKAA